MVYGVIAVAIAVSITLAIYRGAKLATVVRYAGAIYSLLVVIAFVVVLALGAGTSELYSQTACQVAGLWIGLIGTAWAVAAWSAPKPIG